MHYDRRKYIVEKLAPFVPENRRTEFLWNVKNLPKKPIPAVTNKKSPSLGKKKTSSPEKRCLRGTKRKLKEQPELKEMSMEQPAQLKKKTKKEQPAASKKKTEKMLKEQPIGRSTPKKKSK